MMEYHGKLILAVKDKSGNDIAYKIVDWPDEFFPSVEAAQEAIDDGASYVDNGDYDIE